MKSTDELDYYLNDILSYTSEIAELDNHRKRIRESWNKIGNVISSVSNPIDEVALRLFESSKDKSDLKASAVAGAVSIGIKSIGNIIKGIGYIYSEYKTYRKEQIIIQKKKEIAHKKVNQAESTLKWAENNFEKEMKIFHNILDLQVVDYENDKRVHYEKRKLIFELCFKSLYLIKICEYVLDTYTHWLQNSGSEYYRLPPEYSAVINELITMKGGILGKISKEEFTNVIVNPKIKSNIMILIENEILINHLPLTLYELVKIKKKIHKQSPLLEALEHNSEFRSELKKINENRLIFLISYLLNVLNLILLYFWNSFGWWNLVILPLNIFLFFIAYFLRIDRKI